MPRYDSARLIERPEGASSLLRSPRFSMTLTCIPRLASVRASSEPANPPPAITAWVLISDNAGTRFFQVFDK